MKNLFRLIILAVIILLNYQCKSEEETQKVETPKTFTLNAELKGLKADYLVYTEKDDRYPDGYRRDTLWVKDEKFTYTDSVEDYKIYFINVLQTRSWKSVYGDKEYTSSTKADVNRLWFIAYPGAEITCKGKLQDYRVDATLSDAKGVNQDLSKLHAQTFPLIDKAHALSVRTITEDLREEDYKVLRDSAKALRLKAIDLKKAFVKSHPKSVAASYIFMDGYYRKYFTAEEAETLFGNFDSIILSGTAFYDETKSRLEAVRKTAIGMQAPELVTRHTLDGSEFKLSSLRGNYVLIDYWGTWCGPCMGEMPKIKEYYNKYAYKNFVVLGVNSGDTKERWKKAIEDNGFNWSHIQTTEETNLLIPFNVNSFPTKVMLDPEGKIIYSSKNKEKVDMYQMIDTIFSKS